MDFKTTTPSLEDVFIAAIEDERAADVPRRPLALLPEESRLPKSQANSVRTTSEVSSDEVAVRAQDLTRRFDSFTAVDQVSFDVRRGEIFGFLGAAIDGLMDEGRVNLALVIPADFSIIGIVCSMTR